MAGRVSGVGGVAPYVPVDGGPFRWTMGLHRLELADWLEVDHRRAAELAEKRRLLDTARETVLVSLPDGDAPAAELLALVVDHLTARDLVTARDGVLVDRATGQRTPTAGVHPLEAASLVVQEDLCVLTAQAGEWRLVAACVCFPSRWSLASKLGCTLLGIHEPVPGFADELARPATT
ncbi:MAG TPA: heme-dependent oxidative N-demethylase subunit alpha family protein, partial [Acidimicrobiales bacterium]|nr:heme-dependent oxidative N-demethylase subunit alpha family protein [Acidimicrobiales bacterium]